ncbi:unnamed protein product [Leptidea sinapis]|uniref:Uncharacterized protein n=1 Tax=Leptidea sinapis TaxID=189913 RepID=A0A5E4QMT9_9NEOP|nr:unnamed protein product [Leptidea sinapis]
MKYVLHPKHVHYNPVLGYYVADDDEEDENQILPQLEIADDLPSTPSFLQTPRKTYKSVEFNPKPVAQTVPNNDNINSAHKPLGSIITNEQKELAVKIIVERLKLVQSFTKSNDKKEINDNVTNKDSQHKILSQIQDKDQIMKDVMKAETLKQKALDIVNRSIQSAELVTEEINKEINNEAKN